MAKALGQKISEVHSEAAQRIRVIETPERILFPSGDIEKQKEQMKVYIHMTGFYEGIYAKREKVFGRLELLKVIETHPYWFIRLNGYRKHDDKYWDGKDTSLCWRFAHHESALAKFKELCSHPEYQEEAIQADAKKVEMREKALKQVASGQLKPFKAWL